MQNCTHNGRLVDLSNPPKPTWREVFKALAMPAKRIHNYRNLHKSMFYDALCELDRKDCK